MAVQGSDELIYGRNAVLEALRAGTPASGILAARSLKRSKIVESIFEAAGDHGLPVEEVERSELDRITSGGAHQGFVLKAEPFRYVSLKEVDADRMVVLDGVVDPANLGSVMRSALAFGFPAIVIGKNRSAQVTSTVRKVAAGAAERLDVARVGSIAQSITQLQRQGLFCIGLDAGAEISLYSPDVAVAPRVALVIGGEGKGLRRLTKERCDQLVSIPIDRSVESLNVGVAAAVAMAEFARRLG